MRVMSSLRAEVFSSMSDEMSSFFGVWAMISSRFSRPTTTNSRAEALSRGSCVSAWRAQSRRLPRSHWSSASAKGSVRADVLLTSKMKTSVRIGARVAFWGIDASRASAWRLPAGAGLQNAASAERES